MRPADLRPGDTYRDMATAALVYTVLSVHRENGHVQAWVRYADAGKGDDWGRGWQTWSVDHGNVAELRGA